MNNPAVFENRIEFLPNFRGLSLAAFISGIILLVLLPLGYYIHYIFFFVSAAIVFPLLYINKVSALYLYVLSYAYTLPVLIVTAEIRIEDLFFVVLASIWLMDKALNPGTGKEDKLFKYPLLIWLAVNGLSIAANLHNYSNHQIIRSGYYFVRMTQYIMVYFIFTDMIKTHRMRVTLIRLIWMVNLFVCLYALYQFHIEGWARSTATLSPDHAHIGAFLVISIFFLIGYYSMTRNVVEKSALLITFVLMIYTLVISASRTSILAFVFGLLVYLLFNRRLWSWVVAGIVITVIGYYGYDFAQNLQDYDLGVAKFTDLETDISLIGRFYIWNQTIDFLINNPMYLITGIGLGAFREILLPLMPLLSGLSGAHNVFLQRLTESGVIGLMLFIYILFIILRASLKRSRDISRYDSSLYYGYFCALLAFLFTGIGNDTFSVQIHLHNILGYFFLITAVVFSFPVNHKNN